MNVDSLKWWISSWEALKAIGGGISEDMEIKLQAMKDELKKAQKND
jgi:hypothetical protein